MGLLAGELIGIDVPQSRKRLYTIMETDGCTADGVSVATNCWVGRRTLRVEDYGKVAATFVDTESGHAVRVVPRNLARHLAHKYAPEEKNDWYAMLLGYQRMPNEELFNFTAVDLNVDIQEIISTPSARARCNSCGEEIINGRQIGLGTEIMCRACFGSSYYRPKTNGANKLLDQESLEKRHSVPY